MLYVISKLNLLCRHLCWKDEYASEPSNSHFARKSIVRRERKTILAESDLKSSPFPDDPKERDALAEQIADAVRALKLAGMTLHWID